MENIGMPNVPRTLIKTYFSAYRHFQPILICIPKLWMDEWMEWNLDGTLEMTLDPKCCPARLDTTITISTPEIT